MKLGLMLQTLEAIEANHRGDSCRCLMTTLDKWLSKADNVTGPLAWITLAYALRRVGEISASEKIMKCKAALRIFAFTQLHSPVIVIIDYSILMFRKEVQSHAHANILLTRHLKANCCGGIGTALLSCLVIFSRIRSKIRCNHIIFCIIF